MTTSYASRMRHEIENYEKLFAGRMAQDVPDVWGAVEERFADQLETNTGVRNLYQYVARFVEGRSTVAVLGLGSGACGNELDGIAPLLKEQGCEMELSCVDVNDAVLRQANDEALARGIPFEFLTQDVNQLSLQAEKYDVIVAYASLHHFLELDHVCAEINKALKPDGIFVTVDIPTRNGYLMWDETLATVNSLWNVLPARYRMDHTGFGLPTLIDVQENIDYSTNCFECINSEAIMPALRKNLTEVAYVPAMAICRRFFDTKFGPNYDLRIPLDRAIFEFVMNLDQYFIETGTLKPETFFGAYIKKREGNGPLTVTAVATAPKNAASHSNEEQRQLRLENEAYRIRMQNAERDLAAFRGSRLWKVATFYYRVRHKLGLK